MNYYTHPYISNSNLSALKVELMDSAAARNYLDAYRMGYLIDAMITSPELVDHLQLTIIGSGYDYTKEEFELCRKMKLSFLNDAYCRSLLQMSTGQKEIYVKDHPIKHEGFSFTLDMKCKPDLYSEVLQMGPDIKSTTATTWEEFYKAAIHFDYPRQRALYMSLTGFVKDMLIGISKIAPYQIFKIPIVHGDKFHTMGQKQFEQLAYQYYMHKVFVL